MKKPYAFLLAATIASIATVPAAPPARADTTSTVAIAALAAVIVGAILVDSNNQPYYVNNGRHIYVSQNTATYYPGPLSAAAERSRLQQPWRFPAA